MLVPQELAQVVQAEQAALLEAQVPHSSKQPLVQLAVRALLTQQFLLPALVALAGQVVLVAVA